MLKPITDLFKYIKIYQIYLGYKMYIIYVLGIIASIFEGIGILMLLPLLKTIDNSNSSKISEDFLSRNVYDFINFIGFSNSILSILILIVVSFILKGIMTFFALGFNAYLVGQLLKKIKTNLFVLYTKMTSGYYYSKNTGDLINIINEQPIKSLEAFKQLNLLCANIFNTIILILLAFIANTYFGFMAIISGIILVLVFLKMNSYVQKLSRINASESGNLNKWLIQTLHGFKYLASTSQISKVSKKIKSSISTLTSIQIKTGIASAFSQSIREPIAVVFIVIILFFQLYIYNLKLEPILVSLVLFYRALNSSLAVQSAFQAMFQHIGSMELVHKEFLELQNNQEVDGEVEIPTMTTGFTLSNICFKYQNSNDNILNNISLNIPATSSVAFVGESGSGKTSLIDVLTTLNKHNSGELLIDGLNSKTIRASSWRKQIGYVSQDGLIFDDTITNNITLWDESNLNNNLNALKEAATQANIIDFIETLPEGFETKLGDRGVLISGGQKQRILIARELYKKPNLLILDEATSALDSDSESKIQNSIDSLKGKITLVIIAHRLSTIKNVDCIYLLDKGEIVESGNYNQLINNNSFFSNFAKIQAL
mgnify:CR=1 FL=1